MVEPPAKALIDRHGKPFLWDRRPPKSVLGFSVWLRQMCFEPAIGLQRKSAVCGLNGHRSIFVIDLSVDTCEHAI